MLRKSFLQLNTLRTIADAAGRKSVAEILVNAPKVNKKHYETYDEETLSTTNAPRRDLDKSYLLRDTNTFEKRYNAHEISNKLNFELFRPRREKAQENAKCVSKVKHKYTFYAESKDQAFEQAVPLEPSQIPRLAHGLSRVLFNPGVHYLQDPRTRTYNFTPYLKDIVSYRDFDFSKVENFVSASKDVILSREAKRLGLLFYLSTSSMTLTLVQFYLALNNYNVENTNRFPFAFSRTALTLPSSVIVEPKAKHEDGRNIYSISSDKSADVEILLGAMGHALEALLTNEETEFKNFLIGENIESESRSSPANVYNYLKCGDFLMRSQLDCFDARLPGNGTFDLKTRAVCAVRYDKAFDAENMSYQIWKAKGRFESFEREYQDLIRTSAMLKYGFQARIGRMDGIFVAYHNVKKFFGFQYLPLEEIDEVFYTDQKVKNSIEGLGRLEDPDNPHVEDNLPSHVAETQFKASLQIWEDILKTVIKDLENSSFADSPFRLIMKRQTEMVTKRSEVPGLNQDYQTSYLQVYAVPLTLKQVHELQDFSSKFQTSFKDDITPEERLENLKENRTRLDNFNSSLIQKLPVLSYRVNAHIKFNNSHPSTLYPHLMNSEGYHTYTISRCDQYGDLKHGEWEKESGRSKVRSKNTTKEEYLRILRNVLKMLTSAYSLKTAKAGPEPQLLDQVRLYSKIGEKRVQHWNELENPPRVFEEGNA